MILFTGAKTSTGSSWCPDCVRAAPIFEEAIAATVKDVEILVCDCVRRDYQSNDYPYKVNPKIRLDCVPTLINWKNGKVVARLNDAQCLHLDLVFELINL